MGKKSDSATLKVIRIPAGKWQFVEEREKSVVIRIGPFAEGIPKAVAMVDKQGDLLVSASFARGERLWGQILKNYRQQQVQPPQWGSGFAALAKAKRLESQGEGEAPVPPTAD